MYKTVMATGSAAAVIVVEKLAEVMATCRQAEWRGTPVTRLAYHRAFQTLARKSTAFPEGATSVQEQWYFRSSQAPAAPMDLRELARLINLPGAVMPRAPD